MGLIYREPQPIARVDAEAIFAGNDYRAICDALIGVVFWDDDVAWQEDLLARLSVHPEPDVRGLVATCAGHIARIHGRLDLAKVRPVLDQLAQDSDPTVVGQVEDAWDDIRMFLRTPSATQPGPAR